MDCINIYYTLFIDYNYIFVFLSTMYSKDFIENVRSIFKEEKSIRKTAERVGKSPSTISYIIKNNYQRIKKKTGPKYAIKPYQIQVRRMISENQKVTAKKIQTSCDIDVSLRSVQRSLSRLGFSYKKVDAKLPLTKQHKNKRVELARKWIAENIINKNVVFTDEKRFKCDGPDNWCSWYDPFDPPQRIKRQMGGGGIMVWGLTLPTGEIFVKKLEGKVNSSKYINLIKFSVKPYLNKIYPYGNYLFQQDNCKVHMAKATLRYMKTAKIDLLEWPSMSPDMNIQENIWHIISEEVYDRKQFDNLEDLWSEIVKAVDKINKEKKEIIKGIYDKYNSRLLKVIDNNGNDIPY